MLQQQQQQQQQLPEGSVFLLSDPISELRVSGINNKHQYYIVFEVLTPVVMNSTICWDITLRCSLKVNWHFGGRSLCASL
jgi:hypothetical protein